MVESSTEKHASFEATPGFDNSLQKYSQNVSFEVFVQFGIENSMHEYLCLRYTYFPLTARFVLTHDHLPVLYLYKL